MKQLSHFYYYCRHSRKAAKALLVLIPLLGLTYLVVLVQPKIRLARIIFQFAQATLLSTQGFTVSILYCFLNGEVKNAVRHRYRRWKTNRQLYGRRTSRSQHWDTPRYSRTESIRLVTTPSIVITTPGSKNGNCKNGEDAMLTNWVTEASATMIDIGEGNGGSAVNITY
ncbi:CRHR2 (predicted) [Pycnogonum litorale]